MTPSGANGAKGWNRRVASWLAAALLLGAAFTARADDCVADAGGVIDGFVNYPVPPVQINIDGNCTIRNYPASNPLTSNISWFGNNPTSWLLIMRPASDSMKV